MVSLRLPREGGRLIEAIRVRPGDKMSMSYLHSVEGTAVEGIFRVGSEGRLLAEETRLASSGTGLPNVAPGRARRAGEWLVVDEGQRPLESIRFFFWPKNRLRLELAGREVDLTSLKPGDLMVIQLEPVAGWRYLLWSVLGAAWPSQGVEE